MSLPLTLGPGEEEPRLFEVPAEAIVARVGLRAFYRCHTGRQGTRLRTRLHVLRDVPVQRYTTRWPDDRPEAWCGMTAGSGTRSTTVYVDPLPPRPPEGLEWCANCLGHLAERLDLLTEVGELLAAAA